MPLCVYRSAHASLELSPSFVKLVFLYYILKVKCHAIGTCCRKIVTGVTEYRFLYNIFYVPKCIGRRKKRDDFR